MTRLVLDDIPWGKQRASVRASLHRLAHWLVARAHRHDFVSLAASSTASAKDLDCAEFNAHAAAQQYFVSHCGSPSNNVDLLDPDHDGIACDPILPLQLPHWRRRRRHPGLGGNNNRR
jgi:hypothetical protein